MRDYSKLMKSCTESLNDMYIDINHGAHCRVIKQMAKSGGFFLFLFMIVMK